MNQICCPCGSRKSYATCCGRFLDGGERAHTPEQLMRSRYTAHALGNHGDYLVCTWLSAVELGLTAESFAEHRVNWQRLEIVGRSQRGDIGTVEFRAYFLEADSAEMKVHHERSLFKRIDGVWFYIEAMDM